MTYFSLFLKFFLWINIFKTFHFFFHLPYGTFLYLPVLVNNVRNLVVAFCNLSFSFPLHGGGSVLPLHTPSVSNFTQFFCLALPSLPQPAGNPDGDDDDPCVPLASICTHTHTRSLLGLFQKESACNLSLLMYRK